MDTNLPATLVVIFVTDTNGRYFTHKRSPLKQEHPSLYGLGAGGKIHPGEKVAAAAARELEEETGINGEPHPLFLHRFATGPIEQIIALSHIEVPPQEIPRARNGNGADGSVNQTFVP